MGSNASLIGPLNLLDFTLILLELGVGAVKQLLHPQLLLLDGVTCLIDHGLETLLETLQPSIEAIDDTLDLLDAICFLLYLLNSCLHLGSGGTQLGERIAVRVEHTLQLGQILTSNLKFGELVVYSQQHLV
ncbi:hypothetical protein SDC9_55095 [bioreactor metagenome]|uniref:Uncharacterized protein n=1 Tax=bioreactor metagenome TaxID=1076179 RepID=A0A644WY97_9ZZZZ